MFNDQNKSVEASKKALNFLYEMLFCDELFFFTEVLEDRTVYPWKVLFDPLASAADFYSMIDASEKDSRIQLLAYTKLREGNHPILKQELLGVIVEVGLEKGLDVLAAYQDGTARYLHHSGQVIIWDSVNEESLALTNALFTECNKILPRIGVWPHTRRNPPATGNARITLLASDGLHFGEAACDTLFNDELAAPALLSATALLTYLTAKVTH